MRKSLMTRILKTTGFATLALAASVLTTSAFGAQDWTTMPAACAGTDNNFYSGVPSGAFPVARFIVPGGRLSFNASHTGYIAVVCNVDNPRDVGGDPAWDQLEITYIDPDGVHTPDVHTGDAYQVLVQLVRVNKTSGVHSVLVEFNSNNDCPLGSFCDGTAVRTMVKPFAHVFDFANYAYAVYGRVFRNRVDVNAKPVLIQMRLNNR